MSNAYQPPAAPPPPPQKKSRGLLWGCLGCGGLMVLVLIIGGIVVASSGGGAPSDRPAAEAGGSGGDSGGEAEAGIGEPVESGAFRFTVTDVETGVTELSDESGLMTETPQGQYVIVHVTVENIGDQAGTFDASQQTLLDAEGKEYSADSAAEMLTGDQDAFLNQINPGNTVEGRLPFDVPTDVEPAKIELRDFISLDQSAVVKLS
ncbi:DUF4352 domain-containing protein [Streptomonospora litoralis]|uniref:Telomeric repeat-binding factor 2 n=1 Tax=Streptomonospora litoralis TaxID=2498135 RepID=A0A4P6Q3D1_9ACTN|nr:DUF4352 domain-containing protein [Streptomonospora litoralis]QBI53399.1 Telomeric repeat-binding factor 2 [Streptomonospora litoralis]